MTTSQGSVQIACVGDSITRGTFVWRPKVNSYPAQLQAMLGDAADVQSFGVNGHAAQLASDRPYTRSEAFNRSIAFRPDVVLIMLGTNDARGDNWQGVEPFERDYRALVEQYLALDPKPQTWLLTPPTLYRLGRAEQVRYAMSELAIREICGAVERVARELDCGLIDVNGATAGHPEGFKLDGVHPGTAGARLIARAVYDAVAADLVA